MKRAHQQAGKGAFDLVEQATQLLRTAPAGTLAAYYGGTLPFLLGLLYFWADMSRSPFAERHLAEAALGMGALFVWMKFWQAVFALRIRAQIAAEPAPRLDFGRALKIGVSQAILQPPGLFVIPIGLIFMVPFGWFYALFQNASAMADREEGNAFKLFKKSWKQARLWPKQNHILLAIMTAFGACVFLNWMTVCLMLPGLLKMLFGIESVFSKSPMALLNTTFFAGMSGLTYLCVDPILKSAYALRCFYGESLRSGDDLKVVLKPFVPEARKTAMATVILLALCVALPARCDNAGIPEPATTHKTIEAPDLDHAINETIHEQKYTWRMPRDVKPQADAKQGMISGFFVKAGKMIGKWMHGALDWLGEKLRKLFGDRSGSSGGGSSGYDWITVVVVLFYVLIAAAVAALAIFLFRVWRGRKRFVPAVAEAILPAPDITDENVGADQLPEDGWTRMARELLERGEFRLAMRAFYLASLAHLAGRNLISVARFKSNRDYERELRRRAHAFPNLLPIFGNNLIDFERIWYGMHEVNRELVGRFAENVEKIKGAA